MHRVVTKEWDEVESRVAETSPLEGRVRAAEEDSEAIHAACARFEEVMAERESVSAGMEKAKEERETLASCIWELEAAAATIEG